MRADRLKNLAPLLLSLFFVFSHERISLAQTTASLAEIETLSGDVQVYHQGNWKKAQVKQNLYKDDRVRTGNNGLVRVLAGDGSRIQINTNSLFILREVAQSAGWIQTRLKQIRRSLYQLYAWNKDEPGEMALENNNPGIEINLETPTIKAGIRGTSLVLKVLPEPAGPRGKLPTTLLMVTDGLVEAQAITGPADTLAVNGGYQVIARQGKPLKLERITISPVDAVQWSLYLPPVFTMVESDRSIADPALGAGLTAANVSIQERQFSKVEKQLDSLTRNFPGESAPYRLLALTLLATNRKEDAQKAALKAVERDPDSPQAAIVLSYTYQALFQLDEAMAWTIKALEFDPENNIALTNLARLQFGEGRIEVAWETVQRNKIVSGVNAESANLEGFILLAMRKTDEAYQQFKKAVSLDSGFGEPHLGLALCLMRQGQTEKAFKEVARAVLLEPQRALFHSYWGKMLHQAGRFDKALNAFKRAHSLDPSDPTPDFYRALVLKDLNRPGEAIRAFNSAIALNDNRAVYRSRFLLDQDLAARNINLSTLYNQLGLNSWARNKALASIKYDYTSYDGHLFYAGSLRTDEDRSYSFTSEALLARMLQPANVNTFNNFNNYSSLFEQPKVQGTVSGLVGENATYGGSGEVFGAIPDANTAFSLGGFYETSDRWRENNFTRTGSGVAIAKWQPTLNDGFLATVSHTQVEQGDATYPRFEYDSPEHPENSFEGSVQRYEMGYHRHLAPRSDLLFHITYLGNDTDLFQKERLEATLDGIPLDAEQTIDAQRPFWQGQLHYTFNVEDHQLLLGTLQYHGETSGRNIIDISLELDGQSQSFPFADTYNEHDISYASYYLQDSWRVNNWLAAEIAAYYNRMENGNPFTGTEWTIAEFDPRIGIIVNPTAKDTLRLAAFRYILPFISPRLDPTDIAGVPIYRNTQEGSHNTEFAFTWEHEWASGFTAANIFHLDKEISDTIQDQESEINREFSGSTKGLELEHDQMLTNRIGMIARYRYLDVDDEVDPRQSALNNVNREEHLFHLGLRYVHPEGYFAGAAQTYRSIRSQNTRPDEDAAATDLEIGYRFPDKRGEASLKILNLFDNQFNWVTDRLVLQGREPARQVLFTLSFNF